MNSIEELSRGKKWWKKPKEAKKENKKVDK